MTTESDNNSVTLPLHSNIELLDMAEFCIMHYIIPHDNIYRGTIVNSKLRQTRTGLTLGCIQESVAFKKWKKVGSFYSILPVFRPIPVGMNMFYIEYSDSAPFRMIGIKVNYDLFKYKHNYMYFITYNRPTPYTVPLYFYQLEGSVFPSFDSNPPLEDWEPVELSPIYVIVKMPGLESEILPMINASNPIVMSNFNPNNIRFHIENGRCIPYNEKYDKKKGDVKLFTLEDCVITNIELQNTPNTIIETVEAMSEDKPIISSFFRRLKPPVIGLIIGLLILTIFTILYIVFIQNI